MALYSTSFLPLGRNEVEPFCSFLKQQQPMGVIRRQSLKHVSVSLIGLLVGAVSTFLVYPHVREGFGLIQVLLQVGLLGLPVMSLGANTVAIRFFPKFQDKMLGHHGFLPLLMLLCGLGFMLSGGIALLFWEQYMQRVEDNAPLIRQYLWMAFPLAFFNVLNTVLTIYSANFKRIVVPTILMDFSQKLILPLLLICVWQQWITLNMALWGMMIYTCCVTISLIVYLRILGEWHWKPDWAYLTPPLKKELIGFISFWVLGGFALSIATKSDVFMVGSLSTVKAAGTFVIAAALAAIIELPIKSLYGASVSSVANHLATEDYKALGKLYQSVSINLLVAGLMLFGGLWVSIDSIFDFFPKSQSGEMAVGTWVFFFIGISKLVDMSTGLNNYMIYYSQHYRYALISLLIAASLTVSLNLVLIPKIGLIGGAISTLVSVVFYNCFNVWLVWMKFKLFPFTQKTAMALGMAIVSFGAAYLIPHSSINWVDIILRGGMFTALFGIFILKLEVSPDINTLAKMLWQKYF
jgi:O-antigen/teichoic acid export membrane protein